MRKISIERTGIYLKTALSILNEKGGEYPSGDLIQEMTKVLNLSEYELSINDSGQYRWLTNFRFHSIGMVKAGWVEKVGGKWVLKNLSKDILDLDAIDIFNKKNEEYEKWNLNRSDKKSDNEIEAEEMDEPQLLMEVKPDNISFQNLLTGISNCRIQIPPFQRSFVWKTKDINFLLDSIYRGYPIGSFIFWRTTRKLPRTRNIGNLVLDSHDISQGTEISYVLDGQQRITSLFAAVKGARIDNENYKFLFDLRTKKFIVSKSESLREIDEENKLDLKIPIGVIFTESRASYNQFIKKYPEEYQNVLHTIYDRFATYRFSVIYVIDEVLKDMEDNNEGIKQVVRMFSRINETGQKLSVVAKMVARCWGEGFDLRESLDEFYSNNDNLLNIREETLLQAASVILNFRKCRTRDILEHTNIQKLDVEWDNITNSFLMAIDFLTSKLKVKKLDYIPFDAILVPLTYFFHKKKDPNFDQSNTLEKWFWMVSLSNRYDSTVEKRLEDDCVLFDKIIEGESPHFSYYIDWETLKSRLISQRYNLRNAFAKTVLSLYSYLDPKNLTDGRDVTLEGVFTGNYKHNFHHIFPIAYLRKNDSDKKDLFDSIINIMFIPAITNLSISSKAPSNYISNLADQNKDIKNILKNHCIPEYEKSGLLENKYLEFLNYRAEAVFKEFRIKTGVGSLSEKLFNEEPSKPIDIVESLTRSFIDEKLKEQVEGSYWQEFIPPDIQDSVNRKIQELLKRHPYKLEEYMQDDVRITFLDIMDYSKIIISNWQIFGGFFGSKGEVDQHFRALKNYRNPIKHTRDLNEVDKRNGEAAILWLENIVGFETE